MLTGRTIDLELVERAGLIQPHDQVSLASLEKNYDAGATGQMNFVRRKDGTRIGYIAHFRVKDGTGISTMLVPAERGRPG